MSTKSSVFYVLKFVMDENHPCEESTVDSHYIHSSMFYQAAINIELMNVEPCPKGKNKVSSHQPLVTILSNDQDITLCQVYFCLKIYLDHVPFFFLLETFEKNSAQWFRIILNSIITKKKT